MPRPRPCPRPRAVREDCSLGLDILPHIKGPLTKPNKTNVTSKVMRDLYHTHSSVWGPAVVPGQTLSQQNSGQADLSPWHLINLLSSAQTAPWETYRISQHNESLSPRQGGWFFLVLRWGNQGKYKYIISKGIFELWETKHSEQSKAKQSSFLCCFTSWKDSACAGGYVCQLSGQRFQKRDSKKTPLSNNGAFLCDRSVCATATEHVVTKVTEVKMDTVCTKNTKKWCRPMERRADLLHLCSIWVYWVLLTTTSRLIGHALKIHLYCVHQVL